MFVIGCLFKIPLFLAVFIFSYELECSQVESRDSASGNIINLGCEVEKTHWFRTFIAHFAIYLLGDVKCPTEWIRIIERQSAAGRRVGIKFENYHLCPWKGFVYSLPLLGPNTSAYRQTNYPAKCNNANWFHVWNLMKRRLVTWSQLRAKRLTDLKP